MNLVLQTSGVRCPDLAKKPKAPRFLSLDLSNLARNFVNFMANNKQNFGIVAKSLRLL